MECNSRRGQGCLNANGNEWLIQGHVVYDDACPTCVGAVASIPGIMMSTVCWVCPQKSFSDGGTPLAGHHMVGTFSPWTFQIVRMGPLKSVAGLTE